MQIVIRVDASIDTGTGHVMRCLALAGILRRRGALSVLFVCRELEGNLCDVVEQCGFAVARLPVPEGARPEISSAEDADQTRAAMRAHGLAPDLLVVDHYGLGESWEGLLRPNVRRILVIDDLANRRHDCDILLDQNLHDAGESSYVGLVGPATRVFVGPRYALLRPEFEGVTARLRDAGLQQLLVFFGGTDPSGESLKLVAGLRILGASMPATRLVLGPVNAHANAIRRHAEGLAGMNVIGATEGMAALMRQADLGIGTCGGAAWERCVVGLPSLVVVTAENQRDDARLLHTMGAVKNLGDSAGVSAEMWAAEVHSLQSHPEMLRQMSYASVAVMRGRKEALLDLEAAIVG